MEDNNYLNTVCKNCSNNFSGNFCNTCGQKKETHKINFHFILHEIQHSLFHIDGGILYTIKELGRRPGKTIRNFIDGKRVNHFKPVTFVIILSIVYYFLEHTINREPFIESALNGMVDAIRDNEKTSEKKLQIFEWLIHNYSYTALLLIPVFSLSSWVAFKKSTYNYFEHLTLNTFLFGQFTFIFVVTLPLSVIFPNNATVDLLRVFFSIIFIFWAYHQFFDSTTKISRIANTILTYILFIVFTLIILSILILFPII